MNIRIEKCINDYKNYGCSGAILMNYQDITGWSSEKSLDIAREYLGGRKIKCGAILACEEILNLLNIPIDDFEKEFINKNGSVKCRELKGLDGNKVLRTCTGCIEDACTILERMREEYN